MCRASWTFWAKSAGSELLPQADARGSVAPPLGRKKPAFTPWKATHNFSASNHPKSLHTSPSDVQAVISSIFSGQPSSTHDSTASRASSPRTSPAPIRTVNRYSAGGVNREDLVHRHGQGVLALAEYDFCFFTQFHCPPLRHRREYPDAERIRVSGRRLRLAGQLQRVEIAGDEIKSI